MHVVIVTDAWYPQVNGVVRVMDSVRKCLENRGIKVSLIEPGQFRTFPCPGYPEIPLALLPGGKVERLLKGFEPDAVHISTEGPLGKAARSFCLKNRWPFTTAYHSKFPEYINARTKIPIDWLYTGIKRFHAPSSGVLTPSPSVYRELEARAFPNLRYWTHGVDTDVFKPRGKDFLDLPRPIHMFVGRVTVDKNIPAFLDLDLPGSKVVVGTGPGRESLIKRYPDTKFIIANGDDELAKLYSAGDVFVFPSLTDTFGLVMLEALACGVPVAAFPVTGPTDVLGDSGAGCLDGNLENAIEGALKIPPERCRAHAETFSWETVAEQFLGYLRPIKSQAPGFVDLAANRA